MTKTKLNLKVIVNRLILFIGFGLLAHIFFVLYTTEREMLDFVQKISFYHILIICTLMFIPWIGYAVRVKMWSNFLQEKIELVDALRVVMTSDIASALSPTAVGGAPVKAALLLNRGYSPGNVGFMLTLGVIEDIIFYTTGVVLIIIFSNSVFLSIISTVSSFLSNHGILLIILSIVIFTYVLLVRHNKIPPTLRILHYLPDSFKSKIYQFRLGFKQSLGDMKLNFAKAWYSGKIRLMASLIILFTQWAAKFSVLIVLLLAFEIDFDTLQIYIRQWIIYVTMLFVPTPGATGGAEASFLLIFGKSLPSDISFLIVSIWRFFTYYYILISSVILFTIFSFFVKEPEDILIDAPK